MSWRRSTRRSKALVLALAFIVAAGILLQSSLSIASPGDAPAEIAYGPPIELGGGVARTYVILDEGRPTELGVTLSEEALSRLPEDGAHGGMVMPDGHSTFKNVLQMPDDNPTPFRHVTLDWNPVGHEPPGIWNLPHFDIHFYTISIEEREAMVPEDPDFMTRGARLPSPKQIPAGFVDPAIPPVPLMGYHLIDPTSPELRTEDPEIFTRTFLYGSWDGRLIFAEPMITRDFLLTRPQVRIPVGLAEEYEPDGFYPASYSINWVESDKEWRIALTDLEWRK